MYFNVSCNVYLQRLNYAERKKKTQVCWLNPCVCGPHVPRRHFGIASFSFDLRTVLPASLLTLPCWGPHSVPAYLFNNLCRNHGAMDRHEYHSRSRSADQRPTIERPTCRSRSTERPHDASLMRSMPSLPSGRSAPPSPALTRCDQAWRRYRA